MIKELKKEGQCIGIISTITGAICWGLSGTCGQYLFNSKGVDSRWLTCMRMLIAGLLLLIATLFKQRGSLIGFLKSKKNILHVIIFGILGLAVCQYTYLKAIQYTNAATATVMQYLGPVFIMILVCIRNLKLPSKKEVIAILLALIGMFILTTHGDVHKLVISKQGLIWGLLAAWGLVLYTLLPVKMINTWGSTVVTACGMFIGGVILWIVVKPWNIKVTLDLGVIISLITIIILGTAVAFALYLYGVEKIGAVKASMIASVEPLSATFFSAVLLKTTFSWLDLLGFICIVGTIFLLARKE